MKMLLMLMTALLSSTATGNARSGAVAAAVAGLEVTGMTADNARVLTDRLQSELARYPVFSVIDAGTANRFGTDDSGRRVAELVLSGSVGRMDSTFVITVNAVDAVTGVIVTTVRRECGCPVPQLPAEMAAVARLLAEDGRIRARVTELPAEKTVVRKTERNRDGGAFDRVMKYIAISGTVIFTLALLTVVSE